MPVTGTVTFTKIVQVPLAAMVPLEKEIPAAPATGMKVGVPQPTVVAPAGFATTMAPGVVGKVSVKLTPLTAAAFGLVSVKVNLDVPPATVGSGAKFLAMVTEVGSMTAPMRKEDSISAL